jgi:hypothetical protein
MDGHLHPTLGDLSSPSLGALVAAQEAHRKFMPNRLHSYLMLTEPSSYIHLEEAICSTASRFLVSA